MRAQGVSAVLEPPGPAQPEVGGLRGSLRPQVRWVLCSSLQFGGHSPRPIPMAHRVTFGIPSAPLPGCLAAGPGGGGAGGLGRRLWAPAGLRPRPAKVGAQSRLGRPLGATLRHRRSAISHPPDPPHRRLWASPGGSGLRGGLGVWAGGGLSIGVHGTWKSERSQSWKTPRRVGARRLREPRGRC